MQTEIEDRFMNLEIKLAYLNKFVDELQGEVVKQQKEIDLLRQENKILSGRISDLSENMEIPSRKPPHY
ncbi:SlyX family protein [Treponema pectinovorum]|uniref:SlyX family protein n=1 Tax=Treponema pectinovorum TaxID=164 RepID=UPI00209089DE|nr:SlyX family protein [Treponema pectinovorum]